MCRFWLSCFAPSSFMILNSLAIGSYRSETPQNNDNVKTCTNLAKSLRQSLQLTSLPRRRGGTNEWKTSCRPSYIRNWSGVQNDAQSYVSFHQTGMVHLASAFEATSGSAKKETQTHFHKVQKSNQSTPKPFFSLSSSLPSYSKPTSISFYITSVYTCDIKPKASYGCHLCIFLTWTSSEVWFDAIGVDINMRGSDILPHCQHHPWPVTQLIHRLDEALHANKHRDTKNLGGIGVTHSLKSHILKRYTTATGKYVPHIRLISFGHHCRQRVMQSKGTGSLTVLWYFQLCHP